MGEHSKIPPSSAHQWVFCHGWYGINKDIEDTSGPEALWGEAGHDAAARMLHGKPVNVGDVMENGVEVDEEMLEAVGVYVNYIQKLVPGSKGYKWGVEQKIHCSNVHEESFGTMDFWGYDPETDVLDIVDLKLGLLLVSAFENWQLLNYSVGLIKLISEVHDNTKIRLHIVQPRAFFGKGFDVWETTMPDTTWHRVELMRAASLNLKEKGPLVTGAHCKYCNGRTKCPALLKKGLEVFETTHDLEAIERSPAEIGFILRILESASERVNALKTAFEEEAAAKIRKGGVIPGWTLKNKPGRQNWSKSPEEVIKIGKLFGVDLSKPGTITPKQAIKKGVSEEIVNSYSERKNSGFKLEQTDEKYIRRHFT